MTAPIRAVWSHGRPGLPPRPQAPPLAPRVPAGALIEAAGGLGTFQHGASRAAGRRSSSTQGGIGPDVRMSPGPPCSFLPNVTPNGFPRLLGPQAVVRASKGVDHPHEHFVVHGHVVESRRAESPTNPSMASTYFTPVRDRRRRTRLPREGLHWPLSLQQPYALLRASATEFHAARLRPKSAGARATLIQCRGRRWQARTVTNVP